MKKINYLIAICFQLIAMSLPLKAQYSILLNFNGTNGDAPLGSLIISGKMLYGLATHGGAYNYGCIFSIDTIGGNYRDLHDFNDTNGEAYPCGSLLLSGGILYGMTHGDDVHTNGGIFSIDTDGAGYMDLFSFDGTNGHGAYGALIISENILYGMTSDGGVHAEGNIFSVHTDGSAFKELFDFDAGYGANPYGSLTLLGSNLYGMTGGGGIPGYGVIFSIDTNGTGYKQIHVFNDTTGGGPGGSLTLFGKVFYGITAGGVNNLGSIFSMDTDGSNYKDLLNFNGTNGELPEYSSLTLSHGRLYGMIGFGGQYYDGCIFSIDTNGTSDKVLFDFDNTDGETPSGDLTLSGNTLYGMTGAGGTTGDGVVFKIDTNTTTGIHILTQPNTIKVYPNPTKGIITFEFNKSINGFIDLFDVKGSSVLHKQITNSVESIDCSGLTDSVYLYKVMDEKGNIEGEGKVVIQK